MIQRIQSVFLFLAACCLLAVPLTTIWYKSGVEQQGKYVELDPVNMAYLNQNQLVENTSTVPIAIIAFVAGLVAIATIFAYRNRLRQVQLNLLNTLLCIGLIFLNIYFLFQGTKYFEVEKNQGTFGPGFFLPMAALLFIFLANRFIRRDEKLVRSIDRLR